VTPTNQERLEQGPSRKIAINPAALVHARGRSVIPVRAVARARGEERDRNRGRAVVGAISVRRHARVADVRGETSGGRLHSRAVDRGGRAWTWAPLLISIQHEARRLALGRNVYPHPPFRSRACARSSPDNERGQRAAGERSRGGEARSQSRRRAGWARGRASGSRGRDLRGNERDQNRALLAPGRTDLRASSTRGEANVGVGDERR
jgi:hypothetical protein